MLKGVDGSQLQSELPKPFLGSRPVRTSKIGYLEQATGGDRRRKQDASGHEVSSGKADQGDCSEQPGVLSDASDAPGGFAVDALAPTRTLASPPSNRAAESHSMTTDSSYRHHLSRPPQTGRKGPVEPRHLWKKPQ